MLLLINTGSSSVKLTLWGHEGALRSQSFARDDSVDLAEFSAPLGTPEAVTHRVVHAGDMQQHAFITPAVERAIHDAAALAPLHNPVALRYIAAARTAFGPATPQMAALDTAFFANLPEHAAVYALPPDVGAVRRYGFHGLAHTFMVRRCLELDRSRPRRLVTVQLGAGCSATASLDGREPGDPEIRVTAPPTVRAVRVKLPFAGAPRDAVRDPSSGDWVLRFLVPSGLADGSYDARVELIHQDGSIERRSAPIRVDTSPAAVAVLDSGAFRPGQRFWIAMKPALPLGRALAAFTGSEGTGNALKAAMEVKEILVRAPWGEVARAHMEGPIGAWQAELQVPADWTGSAQVEIVASDAAGNVSRRELELSPDAPPLPGWVAALSAVLLATMAGGLALVLRLSRAGVRKPAVARAGVVTTGRIQADLQG